MARALTPLVFVLLAPATRAGAEGAVALLFVLMLVVPLVLPLMTHKKKTGVREANAI